MSRDYKHSTQKKKSAPAPKPSLGIMPFLTGLSLGLFVAFFVYLQGQKPAGESLLPQKQAAQQDTSAKKQSEEKASSGIRPRFDFYTILPESEVKVPEWEPDSDGETPAQNSGTPEAAHPASYILQVGSFQKYEDADRVKARLALLGIQAEIQRVVINGQNVWFRVRVGPLKAGKALKQTQSLLSENGMDSLLLKIRDE